MQSNLLSKIIHFCKLSFSVPFYFPQLLNTMGFLHFPVNHQIDQLKDLVIRTTKTNSWSCFKQRNYDVELSSKKFCCNCFFSKPFTLSIKLKFIELLAFSRFQSNKGIKMSNSVPPEKLLRFSCSISTAK